jgi:hypothetical protein
MAPAPSCRRAAISSSSAADGLVTALLLGAVGRIIQLLEGIAARNA